MLVTIWYLVKKYFDEEDRKRRIQNIFKNQEIITPLRLQAYERIILFLERISPENILYRINKHGYNCKQFQTELLNAIRAEYEHNISQQLYLSITAWEKVKMAKNNVIHLINSTFENLKPDDPSINLSMAIMETTMKQPILHTTDAINFIKEEMNSLIG